MDIYGNIRKLAKSIKSQNLFQAVKEINGLRLFDNESNLSKIQQVYISYLYFYDTINRDIVIDKISKRVFESELYEDSYMLYKKEKGFDKKEKDSKKHDVKLVMSNKINFPISEDK